MMTEKELLEKVWEVEHVQIQITSMGMREEGKILVFDDYPYDKPISGDLTVDEFKEQRILPLVDSARHITIEEYNEYSANKK